MRKTIKKVIYQPVKLEEGIYASPSSFKLELREFMKKNMSSKYFKKSEDFSPAKNLGCYIFGQKDTWKGIIGINYKIIDNKTNKSIIEIYIDEYRIKDNLLPNVTNIIEETLNKIIKETTFVNEYKKEKIKQKKDIKKKNSFTKNIRDVKL